MSMIWCDENLGGIRWFGAAHVSAQRLRRREVALR